MSCCTAASSERIEVHGAGERAKKMVVKRKVYERSLLVLKRSLYRGESRAVYCFVDRWGELREDLPAIPWIDDLPSDQSRSSDLSVTRPVPTFRAIQANFDSHQPSPRFFHL